MIKRRGDCPFNQGACIITTLIKAAKSLRCHLSSRHTGRMRFWLILLSESVWKREQVCVCDCPKDKSWQPSKKCKNHNCVEPTDNNIPSPRYSSGSSVSLKKGWNMKSHLYRQLTSFTLYLRQWLISGCGWVRFSVASNDGVSLGHSFRLHAHNPFSDRLMHIAQKKWYSECFSVSSWICL